MTENSWQEYVEKDLLGSHHIKEAMIIGVEDATIWASSPSFAHITQEEVDSIIQLFQQDKEASYETGIRLSDQHFLITNIVWQQQTRKPSITYHVAYAKNGLQGLIFLHTKTSILVGWYAPEHQPSEALNAMEKLAVFLLEMDY